MENHIYMTVPYFQTPNDIFDMGLTPHEFVVYSYLTRLGNQRGSAFPSYQTIADKTNMSRRKAIDCVKALETKKLLFKEVRKRDNGDNYSNIYHVVNELKGLTPNELSAPPDATDAPIKRTTETRNKNNNVIRLKDAENVQMYVYDGMYHHHLRKWHPRISVEQKQRVEDALKQKGWTYSEFAEVLKYHFNNLPEGNDGNILAFVKCLDRYEYEALGNY